MTESNQQKILDSWQPEKLAEAGLYVHCLYDRYPLVYGIIKPDACGASWWTPHGGWTPNIRDADMFANIRDAYAKATRIAKERQRPKVWWVNQQLLESAGKNVRWDYVTSKPDEGTDTPFIITDGRVVGETSQRRIDALTAFQCGNQTNHDREVLIEWKDEMMETNAAIAAAMKENSHE